MIKDDSWINEDGKVLDRLSPFEISADKFAQPFIKTALQKNRKIYAGMVLLDRQKLAEAIIGKWVETETGTPSFMDVSNNGEDIKNIFISEESIFCVHHGQCEDDYIYTEQQRAGRYTVDWMTTNKDVHEKMNTYTKDKAWEEKEEGNIFALVQANNHIYPQALGFAAINFIPSNYHSEVEAKFKNVVTELNSTSPNGRLVIIDGVPGTGKSYLVRSLISEVKSTKWIFISADLASAISGPALLGTLLECRDSDHQSVTILLEDADDSLNKRSMGNVSTLSTLLNASDGILGNIANFRVVCTTNSPMEHLDEAVLRDCRLLERIEVPLLTKEGAEKAFLNIAGTEIELDDEQYSLANIYKLAKKGTYSKKKKQKKVGF